MIKKLILLVVTLLCVTITFAQDTAPATGKTFGGRDQYKTFSIGVNAGVLSPVIVIGGSNDYKNWGADFGYSVYLKKQLGHVFGLHLNTLFGKLSGNNNDAPGAVVGNYKSFETKIGYGVDVRGVFNLASINFLQRKNAISFSGVVGYGLLAYAPSYVAASNTVVDWKGKAENGSDYIKEAFIPVGVGAKFKVSDRVSFNLDYAVNFIDSDNLDARYFGSNDKFSFGSLGLEFALGAKSKPNLILANPVSTAYDELKDDSLRIDVEALKGRGKKVEDDIINLKMDADGDGVADYLDKCPNTPATVKVDGAGCPLHVQTKK